MYETEEALLMAVPFKCHWLPEPAEEFKVTDPPWQKVVEPVVAILGCTGIAFTVTVTGEEAVELQLPAVAITV